MWCYTRLQRQRGVVIRFELVYDMTANDIGVSGDVRDWDTTNALTKFNFLLLLGANNDSLLKSLCLLS